MKTGIFFLLIYFVIQPFVIETATIAINISNRFLYAESFNNEAYNNYIKLKKLYIKWNIGLFKSTRYYKKYTTKYLISIVGKEILTDYNYFLISPEVIDKKQLMCKLYLQRWLQIRGDIKQEDLISIVEKDPTLLTRWWRSKKMLSVKGRIKDFELDSDIYGEVVILYLKDIKIKESDKK